MVTVPSDAAYTPEMFLKSGYCPPVEIRPGTESLQVFERGHEDDQNFVRFQGSITQTARECHVISADTLAVKLGVAGRIAAGPKGTAGNIRATLRIAVVKQNGGKVFVSQAFKVDAVVAPPDFAGNFSQVVEPITLTLGPSDRDLIIYVGFDEGKPKPKPNG